MFNYFTAVAKVNMWKEVHKFAAAVKFVFLALVLAVCVLSISHHTNIRLSFNFIRFVTDFVLAADHIYNSVFLINHSVTQSINQSITQSINQLIQ